MVGAGIVGACLARALRSRGLAVTAHDRKGVVPEASVGRAGVYSFFDTIPIATPCIMRRTTPWRPDPTRAACRFASMAQSARRPLRSRAGSCSQGCLACYGWIRPRVRSWPRPTVAISIPSMSRRDSATYPTTRTPNSCPSARNRAALDSGHDPAHPETAESRGLSNVLRTGLPTSVRASARNALIHGDNQIDRSACGTGMSARMVRPVARGLLRKGEEFMRHRIIASMFRSRIERRTRTGEHDAIIPSVAGRAGVTEHNSIFIDDRNPFAFSVVVT